MTPETILSSLLAVDRRYPAGAGSATTEKMFLFSLVAESRFQSVLEIGVSAGHLTCWLAAALQVQGRGRMVSVDNWSRDHGGAATSPDIARARLQKVPVPDVDHSFVSQNSIDYLRAQEDDAFDFVWVDGHHGIPEAAADVQEALRVARVAVGVHDTNQKYPGPRMACENLGGFWIRAGRGTWIGNV